MSLAAAETLIFR